MRRHARIAIARAKTLRQGKRLPPGNFFRLSPIDSGDRTDLVNKVATLGPLLTAMSGARITICIVGFVAARRLLLEHADDLRPVSIQLKPLVTHGFLRTMEGQTHRHYRDIFSRAMSERVVSAARSDLESLLADGVKRASASRSDEERRAILKSMSVSILIRTFYGVRAASGIFAELRQNHLSMGPDRFSWNVGPAQKKAFDLNRSCLDRILKDRTLKDAPASASVLSRLNEAGPVDETTLGNLIYMVEMGRNDLESFFAWMFRFLEEHPTCLEDSGAGAASSLGRSRAEAVVLETLRMEQSERLVRMIKRDFIFDGFLMPRGAMVRVCLWETHKDGNVFANPFVFDGSRFLQNDFGMNQYAPFGLDHHRCPAAGIVMEIATMFVRSYASGRIR